ncbi:MAG: alpha/beta hydrolase [Candidatus Eisenbacteria sp.]|nr:alpha/beta hydrolase [Candidatus Eisenbacteria bacterium]
MRQPMVPILILIVLAALSCQERESTSQGPAEGTVSSADGLGIHYRTRGSGEPALVFVHGWSCDGSYWTAQWDHFTANHQVVTIDLGGHGQSGLGRGRWSMVAFGADVRAVVEKLDLDDVVLIGHSMGGAIIVEATLGMPGRVRGLVGVDNFQTPYLDMTPQQIEDFVSRMQVNFVTNTEDWVRSMFPPGADPLMVDKVAKDMASAPPEVATSALRELLIWYSTQAPAALEKLRVPLQCISSDKHPTDVEGISAIVDRYELRLMPGHGHFLMLEDPATFNSLLEDALDCLATK